MKIGLGLALTLPRATATGSGGPADPPGTADLRAYFAGDVPPGLFPSQLSGQPEILADDPAPQSLILS